MECPSPTRSVACRRGKNVTSGQIQRLKTAATIPNGDLFLEKISTCEPSGLRFLFQNTTFCLFAALFRSMPEEMGNMVQYIPVIIGSGGLYEHAIAGSFAYSR